ncbi:putative peptidoglycan binding domain protein [compost metagenome]
MRSEFLNKVFGQSPRKTPDWAGLLTQTTPEAPSPAKTEGDRLAITPKLSHARFSAHADLLAVLNGPALTKGAKSEGVKALQTALLDLGFGLPSGADGAFGNELKRALEGFQSSQGLPMTGELDAKTLKALDAVAPAAGKKAWEDPDLSPKAYLPAPQVKGKPVRVAVDTSEHRLFLYDKQGQLERIYPIATGAAATPTDPMIKIVSGFLKDPSSVARQLWPESGGKAFGTRLVDLSQFDPETGKATRHGEELHGTFTRQSIGTDASHGCMRLYNEDIEDLYSRLKQGEIVVVQK